MVYADSMKSRVPNFACTYDLRPACLVDCSQVLNCVTQVHDLTCNMASYICRGLYRADSRMVAKLRKPLAGFGFIFKGKDVVLLPYLVITAVIMIVVLVVVQI